MAQTKNVETFGVHPQIIFDIIARQTGTVGKAIQEGVQNSYDAGATFCNILLDEAGFVISDNGKGFSSADEIRTCFGTFGFPHEKEEGDSRFAKFRVGRGQLLSMAPTIWDTRRFQMNVDIKNKGLDYELLEKNDGTEFYPGCRITGEFYSRLSPSDLRSALREVEELMPFFPIPVTLNGKQINTVPADATWDIETEDAYIKMKATGGVKVYNFGAFVQTYPEYHMGCSAIVVTKKHLTLNMARNSILEAECTVWRGIKKRLRDMSGQSIRQSSKRLTVGERQFLAEQFIAGEIDIEDIRSRPLIQDVSGKWHKVEKLQQTQLPVTAAPMNADRRAELLHSSRVAFVLHPRALEMFGADSAKALVHTRLGFKWTETAKFDSLIDLVSGDYMTIASKDLRKDDQLTLRAMQRLADGIMMLREGIAGESMKRREVRAGTSEVASAWTDGSTYIVLREDVIKGCRRGLTGFCRAAAVIAHEYIHDNADTGSHEHDSEFYEGYHDLVIAPEFADQAVAAYRWFVKKAVREGVALNTTAMHDADTETTHENHAREYTPDNSVIQQNATQAA